MKTCTSGLICAATIAFVPVAALADGRAAEARALYEAMGLPQLLEVMHAEGVAYGEEIALQMFPGPAPAEWPGLVAEIHDVDRMEQMILVGLGEALADTDVAAMVAFYETEPGATIAQLEIQARRARLDPDVEAAADESAALAAFERSPRFLQLEKFIEVNDLIETNVVSTMNFNYAFFQGMVSGGSFAGEITEEQILTDVWSQEEEIRLSTTDWLYSYLYMAYQPISDADLDAYIAFTLSEAGQDLNRALNSAFDAAYLQISRDLGRASAEMMLVQEL